MQIVGTAACLVFVVFFVKSHQAALTEVTAVFQTIFFTVQIILGMNRTSVAQTTAVFLYTMAFSNAQNIDS